MKFRGVPLLCVLLGFAANAQFARDRCLGPRAPQEVGAVAAAWADALAGRDGTWRIPPPSHPCQTGPRWGPVQYVEVADCTPDGRHALVSVGRCGAPNAHGGDSISCGAALIDLNGKRFAGYVASKEDASASQRFLGAMVVNSWAKGVEVRSGARFGSVQTVPGARVLDVLPDQRTLLLAIREGRGERLASLAPGERAPRMLSSVTEQVMYVWSMPGTPLIRADLMDEVGPGRLLFVDPRTGARAFEVKGAIRNALAPDGARLLTVVEQAPENQVPKFVHELRAREGKPARLASELPFTSAVRMAASWKTEQAAVAAVRALELLSLAPLAKVKAIHPFGDERAAPEIQRLHWSAKGGVLMVYGLQITPEGLNKHSVALLRGADGEVLKRLDALPASPDDGGDIVLRMGERTVRVTEEGELEDHVPPVEAGPPRADCTGPATELLERIAQQSRQGILLPKTGR